MESWCPRGNLFRKQALVTMYIKSALPILWTIGLMPYVSRSGLVENLFPSVELPHAFELRSNHFEIASPSAVIVLPL